MPPESTTPGPFGLLRDTLVARLERTYRAWKPWSVERPSRRPPFVLDDYFNALADAGAFNRLHPELAIAPPC